MNASESVMAQIRKVRALAMSGVAGERETAAAMLEKLCAKHGISPDALIEEERHLFKFSYKGDREKGILVQVILHVTQRRDVLCIESRSSIEFRLTNAEAIDAKACWAHYRKEWVQEFDAFFQGFIHQHKIYGAPPENANPPPISMEELMRIRAMMRAVSGQSWTRPAAAIGDRMLIEEKSAAPGAEKK